jgi:pimeloyl-ACP methyl ester carboxylesterase
MAKSVDTPILNIACEESGKPQGFPIILLHGFPDDVRAWDDVIPPLVEAGYRVLVPYLVATGLLAFAMQVPRGWRSRRRSVRI